MTGRTKDKAFLRIAHEKIVPCRFCGERPFQELHHFGSGGMALKGSDYLVVRLCTQCHHDGGPRKARKVRAMRNDEDYETLAICLQDAADLMEAYIIRLRRR
ncbi:MAG: hypothetical protein U9Q07_03810 [Planctomycetota bacterium]|nr:hypothetical protein [Planctomycetota bacterium]